MRTLIKFRAFIPKSVGNSMMSYFENDRILKGGLLKNKDNFLKSLKECDEVGHHWIKEPMGPTSMNCYAATDDTEIEEYQKRTKFRLGFECSLDLRKIGLYNQQDRNKIFIHQPHRGAKNSTQHSSQSHRVEAYIKRIPFYDEVPKASANDLYFGVCEKAKSLTSKEKQLACQIISRSYDKRDKSSIGKYTSIKVAASANYPYVMLSPNIDFEVFITVAKKINGNIYGFSINGTHNLFPAYELIIDNRQIYHYNPIKRGENGPGLLNLNRSKDFSISFHKKN